MIGALVRCAVLIFAVSELVPETFKAGVRVIEEIEGWNRVRARGPAVCINCASCGTSVYVTRGDRGECWSCTHKREREGAAAPAEPETPTE